MKNLPPHPHRLITLGVLVACQLTIAVCGRAAIISTSDFENGMMPGWNVVTTGGIGDDTVWANGPFSVQPTAFDLESIQGDWIVRTWNQNDGTGVTSIINDSHTGIVRSDPFPLPINAVVDFLIGGGNHPWGAMDPDALAAGPACLNLERKVAEDDWEMIATATGPNANMLAAAQFTQAELAPYVGDTVRFAIYDLTTAGWGHIDIDNIVLSGDDLFDPTDSDGDTIGDAWELFYFENIDRDGTLDFDADGLTDLQEWAEKTHPKEADTDEDGVIDGVEIADGTDPSDPDSDDDGLDDGEEKAAMTLPGDPDTDGDGLLDGYEVDNGLDPKVDDTGDDLDGDGVSNGDEAIAGMKPNDPDTDGDGLADGDEAANNADPLIADTDGDGWSDGAEVAAGTLANDATSSPTSPLITSYDFEDGSMAGWNVVPTTVGDDTVWANGAVSVEPTDFDLESIQGDWIVRTWNQSDGTAGSTVIITDSHTGVVRTDPFTLASRATVDFLIGGGNHPWGAMDPDTLEAGPACFNLERQVDVDDWEMIFTATGPNANSLAAAQFSQAQLEPYAGDTVRFAIYDLSTAGWGHIDVDDIRYSGITSGSGFQISSVSYDNIAHTVTITWPSTTTQNYIIEWAPDVKKPNGEWNEIDDSFPGVEGEASLTHDGLPAGVTRAFYRVRVAP